MENDNQIVDSEIASIIANNGEIVLDALTNSSLIEKIPVFGSILSFYKAGKSFGHLHHLKKLEVFIRNLNEGQICEEESILHVQKLLESREKLGDELGFISIILEKIIDVEHTKFLSKVYLSYLGGKISWNEFVQFSSIIERFLPGDIHVFIDFVEQGKENIPLLLRASSLGLVEIKGRINTQYNAEKKSLSLGQVQNSSYSVTLLGQKFYDSLS